MLLACPFITELKQSFVVSQNNISEFGNRILITSLLIKLSLEVAIVPVTFSFELLLKNSTGVLVIIELV